MSGSGSRILSTQHRWLMPVIGLMTLLILPLLAYHIGADLQQASVGNVGPNSLAAAIPWILAISALVIGVLGFLVVVNFQRRQVRAIRLAHQMTAELRLARDELSAALKKAQEAAKAKDDFLAVMSHELRTPLNGIIGMTTLLVESDLDAQSRDFAETARTCANGLLDVINDILDYSKLESGRVELDDLTFDPRDLVEEVLQVVAVRAQTKGLELIGEVDPHLGMRLRGDPSRLRQLLLNLLANAVKFTERGSVHLTLHSLDGNPYRTRMRIAVADTGIGINAADITRLFAPFTQADGTISRRFGGTGLGLAISKSLCEAMGGSIGATSVPGLGSTFTADVLLNREEPSSSSSLPPELSGRTVLLVDDDATARAAITALLNECGCDVIGAATLDETVAAMAGAKVELAVLDAAAPSDDPVAIVASLRGRTHLAELPVILLTTFATQLRLDLPRTATVAKPVRRRQLRDALLGVLGQRIRPGTEQMLQRFDGVQVLVADHRLGTMRVIAGLLSDLGCKVDLAVDAPETCTMMRRRVPRAIFLASDLPPAGAGDAAHMLRAADFSGLIVATGGSRIAPHACDAAITAPPRASEIARLLAAVQP